MMVDSLLPGEEFTRSPSAMALRKLLRIKSVDRFSTLYFSDLSTLAPCASYLRLFLA
jgi:hypothetical protein